jgi:hypothetical protein
MWDLLCNIVTNTITVHRDISTPVPSVSTFPVPPTVTGLNTRTGVVRSENEDEFGKIGGSTQAGAVGGPKPDYIARLDSYDALFMEDVSDI